MMTDLVNTGLNGIQSAMQRTARNAEVLAALGVGHGDVITPLLELEVNKAQVKASVSVVRTAQALQRTVLDIAA